MSNKSILTYVSGYINRKRYGIKTGNLNPKPLVDTYLEDSNCAIVAGCHVPESCDDDILYKVCNFYIETLTKTDIDYYRIKVLIPSFHNGIQPYTVEWNYDTAIYSLIEKTDTYISLLRIQDAAFNSVISVKVTDKSGCFAYGTYDISFEPIDFTVVVDCPSILYTGIFVAGEANSGYLVVPYTVTGYGNIAVEIDANEDGFSGSLESYPVIPGNGNASFPMAYDGTQPSGTKTIPVKVTYASSVTVCEASIVVEEPVVVLCTAAQNMVIEVT